MTALSVETTGPPTGGWRWTRTSGGLAWGRRRDYPGGYRGYVVETPDRGWSWLVDHNNQAVAAAYADTLAAAVDTVDGTVGWLIAKGGVS